MSNQATNGNDVLIGSFQADEIKAGQGNDVVYALAGADNVNGNAGDDFVSGGFGDDKLKGEDGNDVLLGGAGDDIIFGGEGSDWIVGGFGNDILYGTNRSNTDGDMDVFVFGKFDGNDEVRNFEVGVDKISLIGLFGSPTFAYDADKGHTTMTWGQTEVLFKYAFVDEDSLLIA